MESCWKYQPQARPNFASIIARVNDIDVVHQRMTAVTTSLKTPDRQIQSPDTNYQATDNAHTNSAMCEKEIDHSKVAGCIGGAVEYKRFQQRSRINRVSITLPWLCDPRIESGGACGRRSCQRQKRDDCTKQHSLPKSADALEYASHMSQGKRADTEKLWTISSEDLNGKHTVHIPRVCTVSTVVLLKT